ncbi:TonB-dependent receptor [Undibacterium sp. Dicai25W]|uniref:TonB-dependent receptor n=1 Tax=Undibacterium sp. Dicai25W TaxID=3413034 RepID=UPI003BEFA130
MKKSVTTSSIKPANKQFHTSTLRPMVSAISAIMACLTTTAIAQTTDNAEPDAQVVLVTGTLATKPVTASPATIETVTAKELGETTNVTNVEDALKYIPSIMVRKRFNGDTAAPVTSRTTGVNASARTLIFADGVMLSSLVNNNNGNGSPQWFMVSPEEIDSIDVMYGPFSAAYAGNSYGAVIQMNTRMPRQFEATAKINLSSQNFDSYGTSNNFKSGSLNATIGDRQGAFSWFVSANHLDSFSQPITFGTLSQSSKAAAANLPVINGATADYNRTGGAIQVISAGNLNHTVQDTAKVKLAYDFNAETTLSYMLGYWQNSANGKAASYLRDASGTSYYGATTGNVNIGGYAYSATTIAGQFGSNSTEQTHWMQSLALNSKTSGAWDWNAVISNVNYATDLTRSSTGPYPAAQTTGAGRIADASGTGWTTFDAKATYRPDANQGSHTVSFGVHADQFKLVSPTYNTTDWLNGSNGALYSNSLGKTQTNALWIQDEWRINTKLTATIGGRYEQWKARDGYNYAIAANGTGFPVNQPGVSQNGLSPKATLAWKASDTWQITGSFGRALRFPTVGELYQNVQTGTTFTQANPYLKPEDVLSSEFAFERKTKDSRVRVSLFGEFVSDALISQTSNIAGYSTPVSFTQNVDKTRQRGIELVAEKDNAFIQGLQLSASLTYVDAVILANSSYVPTIAGATSVGKHTPYVPDWRATMVATYRPDARWAYTLAGRYTGRQYATVDNTDIYPGTYQGFQPFFVADARVHYQVNRQWSIAAGIDNLNNEKYYLYHPFTQRTAYAELKYTY